MFTDKLNVGLVNPTYNSPLLWERIEHLTQSVKSVLGEGALRHCERMRSNPEKHQASSCTYKPKYISNKTDSFRIKFGIIINRNNFPFSTFHFQFFAGAREILLFRNNFPLSIFNFPFIQKENRRVRFNAPQPTTKEVLC